MSRWELYGTVYCDKCEHYGVSRLCPRMRCRYPTNTRNGSFGLIYMKTPEDINWDHRCPWYSEEGDK